MVAALSVLIGLPSAASFSSDGRLRYLMWPSSKSWWVMLERRSGLSGIWLSV